MSQTTFTDAEVEQALKAAAPDRPESKVPAVTPELLPARTELERPAGTAELVKKSAAEAIKFDERGRLRLATMDDAWRIAVGMVKNDCIPRTFWGSKNNPRNENQCTYAVFVAICQGYKFGFDPMEAVRVQYMPGNVPTFFGSAVPGIVKSQLRRLGEWFTETLEYMGKPGQDDRTCAIAVSHMRGDKPLAVTVRKFSLGDAKAQGLLNKDTWRHSPDRMLMHRARTYAYNDTFPDIMSGLVIGETEEDYLTLEDNREKKGMDQRLLAAKEGTTEPGEGQ